MVTNSPGRYFPHSHSMRPKSRPRQISFPIILAKGCDFSGPHLLSGISFFKRCCSLIFREGERERERERETLMWERNIDELPLIHAPTGTEPATQACALIRNWTGYLSVCRVTPNQMSHAGQSSGMSFEKPQLCVGVGASITITVFRDSQKPCVLALWGFLKSQVPGSLR